jgi:hypothetical protein
MLVGTFRFNTSRWDDDPWRVGRLGANRPFMLQNRWRLKAGLVFQIARIREMGKTGRSKNTRLSHSRPCSVVASKEDPHKPDTFPKKRRNGSDPIAEPVPPSSSLLLNRFTSLQHLQSNAKTEPPPHKHPASKLSKSQPQALAKTTPPSLHHGSQEQQERAAGSRPAAATG